MALRRAYAVTNDSAKMCPLTRALVVDSTCHGFHVFVGQTDKPHPNRQRCLNLTSSLGAAIGEYELIATSLLLAYFDSVLPSLIGTFCSSRRRAFDISRWR